MIGLFIGSFNPPTLAHLEIAQRLSKRFQKIVFVPVNSQDKYLISLADRILMLNLYCQKYPYLEVDNIMQDYAYFNYRILDLLKKKYGKVTIIMGDDLLRKFDQFEEKDYLLQNYYFCIVTRNIDDLDNYIKDKYKAYQHKFSILKYYRKISSSLVREHLIKNDDCQDYLDNEIILYIKENNLYSK